MDIVTRILTSSSPVAIQSFEDAAVCIEFLDRMVDQTREGFSAIGLMSTKELIAA